MTKLFSIIGMHRSGTSLVGRLTNLLGADLGPEEELMAPKPDNPAGFWENRKVSALHDDLLARLGGRWDRPPFLEDGWESAADLEEFRLRARAILDSSYGGRGLAAWKDPRGSFLLPFWQNFCTIDGTLMVVREPTEVAASLGSRSGMDSETAAELWLRYVVAGWRADRRRMVLSYGDVLERPDESLTRLARFLGVPMPTDDVRSQMDAVIDPKLRHHQADPKPDGQKIRLARAIFRLVLTQPAEVLAPLMDCLHDRTQVAGHLEKGMHETRSLILRSGLTFAEAKQSTEGEHELCDDAGAVRIEE